MKIIIANRTPAVERMLDVLQKIPVAETGRHVQAKFAAASDPHSLAREMESRCLVIGDAQTAAAEVSVSRAPDCGVLYIGAGSGLGAKGVLREMLRERSLDARHVACFGVHRWTLEDYDFANRQRIQYYSMIEISREGLSEMTDAVMMYVRQWKSFHLVLHLDAVDPAFAPGLKSPCAGGFTSRELLYVLQRLLLIQSLVSAELIIDAQADDATARLAAQLVAEF